MLRVLLKLSWSASVTDFISSSTSSKLIISSTKAVLIFTLAWGCPFPLAKKRTYSEQKNRSIHRNNKHWLFLKCLCVQGTIKCQKFIRASLPSTNAHIYWVSASSRSVRKALATTKATRGYTCCSACGLYDLGQVILFLSIGFSTFKRTNLYYKAVTGIKWSHLHSQKSTLHIHGIQK